MHPSAECFRKIVFITLPSHSLNSPRIEEPVSRNVNVVQFVEDDPHCLHIVVSERNLGATAILDLLAFSKDRLEARLEVWRCEDEVS